MACNFLDNDRVKQFMQYSESELWFIIDTSVKNPAAFSRNATIYALEALNRKRQA